MKRSQLIEYGIVVTGLIFGYKFFDATLTLLLRLVYEFQDRGPSGEDLLPYFLFIILYVTLFFMLIRKSDQLAKYLSRDSWDQPIPVKIDKISLLQVVLAGICLMVILSNAAEIIIYLYQSFKNEIGKKGNDNARALFSKDHFSITAVQTIVAIVVLYFSKDIAGWFIKKNDTPDLVLDSTPEN